MTGISVNAHLSEVLNGDEVLSGMTQDIYPIIAENDVRYPFILHIREGVRPIDTKTCIAGDTVEFSIAVVSDKYAQTVSISERVRELLEKRRDGYFSECNFVAANEDYQNDAFVQRLRFSATILRK